MKSPPSACRIVKPPKVQNHPYLPIIAVSFTDRCAAVERTGEILPLAEIANCVLQEPASIWICNGVADLLLQLDAIFDPNPLWQYRVSPFKRDHYSIRQHGTTRSVKTVGTIVGYFGFKNPRKGKGRWHYPVDPALFVSTVLEHHHVTDLVRWGREVRSWCQRHGLAIKPTGGGIAGQLLRDPRFYPEPRRKVPRATNERARAVLPGNHYELRAGTQEVTSAWYLDMRSAHHNCAADLTFPNANTLLGRGHFKRSTDTTDYTLPESPAWAPRGTPRYDTIMERMHGLLLLRLSVPFIHPTRYPPPGLLPGVRLGWWYSNELGTLRELGVSLDGIEAAWGSFDRDGGLNRYAQWCLSELATAPTDQLPWLKPTLLSAYGILAARPRIREYAYKRADKGTIRHYPAGHGVIHARGYVGDVAIEVPTTNVIHRGMIEAETRARSLGLARWLTALGHRVLCVYADAVIVEQGPPLPLLPQPWAVKTALTRLRFLHPNAFHAREMTRLPGIPRESQQRVNRIREIVAPKGTLPPRPPSARLALSDAEQRARLGPEETPAIPPEE